MKKGIFVAGMALAGAALFAFAGCDGGGTALSEKEDLYGLGAVTTVKLLGSEFSGQAVQSLSAVKALSADVTEVSGEAGTEEAKSQAEKFNEYFNMLDGFLGDDLVTTKAEKNPDTEGKYAQYEVKLTVTGRDMYGEAVVNVMYYTETLVKEKTDEEEGKSKATYTLEGVMSAEGTDYVLRGEREAEEERDESEQEIKIRAYPDETDLQTYVQMKQEFSVESDETEKEYVYSIVKDGVVLEETAVEFETERKGGKEETEYELEFRQGEAKGKYSVEREQIGDEVTMKVKYDIDGKKGQFRIRRIGSGADARYEYKFSDDSVIVL